MPRISLDELEALVADPERPDTEIAKYFVLDETASRPFAPVYRLDPETVEVPLGPDGLERSAALLNLANWYAHTRRVGRYYSKVNGGYAGPVIVSEGDSWFQYPVRLHDTIDKLMERYAVYSLGAAGDLLQQIARKQQYLRALQETGGSILLLSGGGNDLVAGGALADYLETFDVDLRPGDYLKPSFQSLLDSAFGHYETICRQVLGAFPDVEILCHGYDYPIPASGRWLGKPMEKQGIRDGELQKAIAAEMMDRFNRGLWRMARRFPQVTYIDCRGVVGDNRWFDELHPTDAGYADVAARFDREIRRIANAAPTRRARSRGPFAGGLPATKSTSRAGRAISLHCGLNEVDPQHYAGWDGALIACENDARAMAKLAAAQGFEPEILLTRAATREAVVASIRSAAETLKDGDMFLWTISCHGGQMPDLNRDEAPDRDGYLKDETLLLYDFQIVDDELYTLWSEFAPGVRILFVPDCCHSGTMIRAAMPGPQTPRIRQIPAVYAARTFVQNEQAYRDYANHYDAIREEVIHNPLTTPVKASVMSLTACQDHQVAMDGARHGAFTEAVLKVWSNGKFNRNYKVFRDEVDRTIDSPDQTPNLHSTGAKDPAFSAQIPFTLWANPDGTVLGAGAQSASTVPLLAAAAPSVTSLRPPVGDLGSEERRARIESIELAAPAGPLPRVRSAFRAPSNDDEAATLTMEKQKLNAAVDASGVISFVDTLTPQQKDDVLLSTLFAQRAATARKNPVTEVQAWFALYLDTLSLLGWSVESAPDLRQATLTQNASFHEAILKILASVATQRQFAILEQALSSLASLSENSSQIRLFDRATSVTEGGHFQVGAAEASGDVVAMALGAFHYRNEDERKNVLFVSWGNNEMTYWMGAQKVNLNTRRYADVRDLVNERLGDNRRRLIADIDLG